VEWRTCQVRARVCRLCRAVYRARARVLVRPRSRKTFKFDRASGPVRRIRSYRFGDVGAHSGYPTNVRDRSRLRKGRCALRRSCSETEGGDRASELRGVASSRRVTRLHSISTGVHGRRRAIPIAAGRGEIHVIYGRRFNRAHPKPKKPRIGPLLVLQVAKANGGGDGDGSGKPIRPRERRRAPLSTRALRRSRIESYAIIVKVGNVPAMMPVLGFPNHFSTTVA